MCSDGLASRLPTGQAFKSGALNRNLHFVPGTHKNICWQTHEQAKHKCTECKCLFKEKRRLIEHIRAKHGGKRLTCPQCQCLFVSRNGLNEHVKHIHQKLANFQCRTCGKGYSRRSHYYDHLATHTSAKRNICTICLRQFTFKCSLKTHVLRFHPNEVSRMKLYQMKPDGNISVPP